MRIKVKQEGPTTFRIPVLSHDWSGSSADCVVCNPQAKTREEKITYTNDMVDYLIENNYWGILEAAHICVCKKCGDRLKWEGESQSLCGYCAG